MNASGSPAPTRNAVPGTATLLSPVCAEALPLENNCTLPGSSPWRRSSRPPAGGIASKARWTPANGSSTHTHAWV
jgi:hypothetical protein